MTNFIIIVISIATLIGIIFFVTSGIVDLQQYRDRERQIAMDKLISAGRVESWITSDNITHIGITVDNRQYELIVETDR